MTYEEARQAIYTRLKTAWDAQYSTIPVNWDNRDRVDLVSRTGPFIGCAAVFDARKQASLGTDPLIRTFGCIYLPVFVREGTGTAARNEYLQFLSTLFDCKKFSGVNTHAAEPQEPAPWNGWERTTVRVEFWFDSIS